MGIASLILGILALLGSWIPIIGFFWAPGAVIGIVLGAVSVVSSKKTQDKGQQGVAIAGLVVSIVALLSIIGFTIFWANAGEDYTFDLAEVVEEYGAQPADAPALSGSLGFQTLAYDCRALTTDSSVAVGSTCDLSFTVSNNGSEAVGVNSTDQTLVYAQLIPIEDHFGQQSSYHFAEIEATSGSCVDLVVEPGETQPCQATFMVPGTYDPQFVRYTQGAESTPSSLVVLPGTVVAPPAL